MNNLADFKRAVAREGTQLETLALARGLKGDGRLKIGAIRKINKHDTTGIYLQTEGVEGRGSFLGFDKASDWTFDGDIIIHREGLSYRVILKEGNTDGSI
jgi:hypothetical protein